MTEINTNTAATIIEDVQHLSTTTLASFLNMLKMLVNLILTPELKMERVCSTWVPHLLTQEQIGLCNVVEGFKKI